MWDNEDDEYNENDNYEGSMEEDVNYEAAKDLEGSRWQGVRAVCRR